MFEDLDEGANRVFEIASEEAIRLHHDFTGTEHILLGLVLCEDDVAAPLLAKHGVSADGVRARVTRANGLMVPASRPTTSLTARAKQVLSLACREADSLGDDEVMPEHLLLGILRQQTGVAALVLRDTGVDLAELRGEILEAREAMEAVTPPGPLRPGAVLFDAESLEGGEDRRATESPKPDEPLDAAGTIEGHKAVPSCPSCGLSLCDVLAVASIAPVSPSSGRRRSGGNVSVIYCRSCGHTLSASR